MFYDIHQSNSEPAPGNFLLTSRRSSVGMTGAKEKCGWITQHITAFKGDFGPRGSLQDASGRTDATETSNLYLAPRELDVFKWAALGKTAWETVHLLGLTEATVRFYTRNACDRLGVKSKTHAVAICISAGLFKV